MKTVRECASVLFLIHCLTLSAFAVPLSSDPAGIPGFTGFQNLANGTMSARLEYAVYSPGTYTASTNAGVDPSGGARYVYAYQIFNTSAGDPISGSTIGQQPNSATTQAQNAGRDVANALSAGGTAPAFSGVLSASVKYDFLSPEILAGGKSNVLIYTSPFAPHYATGTIFTGGFTDVKPVPAPLPEPTTAAFGLLAVAFIARGRRCYAVHRAVTHGDSR